MPPKVILASDSGIFASEFVKFSHEVCSRLKSPTGMQTYCVSSYTKKKLHPRTYYYISVKSVRVSTYSYTIFTIYNSREQKKIIYSFLLNS